MSNEIKLMPIYTYFRSLGYSGEEIEKMTLREIEDILDEQEEIK